MSIYPYIRYAGGPTYSTSLMSSLMSFTYSGGRLDLSSNPGNNAPTNTGAQVFRLGGSSTVTSLGPNLIAYLRGVLKWEVPGGNYYTLSNNSTITIVKGSNGIVTRVLVLDTTNLPPTDNWGDKTYKISTSSPIPNFNSGRSTYLFDQPLVLKATQAIEYNYQGEAVVRAPPSNGIIYITLSTQWDH